MTDYNDLWELDRGDYVNIINELRAELDQARVQLAGCLCAAEGTGDADKVKQGDYAWTPALQKAVELRAALAEAERERDEARSNKGNDTVMLLDITSKYIKALEELEQALAKIERQRRTIRALVVAFRITWYCVNNEYPRARETIKRLLAERGQAREADNG